MLCYRCILFAPETAKASDADWSTHSQWQAVLESDDLTQHLDESGLHGYVVYRR